MHATFRGFSFVNKTPKTMFHFCWLVMKFLVAMCQNAMNKFAVHFKYQLDVVRR